MVLWEIALGTAYFLGLKRTYRHALRIQRRLVSPNSPRIRQFLHRRTRTVFDATLRVHSEVQKRDIEVGRNLGNWILRWLDKMKPMAEIRAGNPTRGVTNRIKIPKYKLTDSRYQKMTRYRESSKRFVASSKNLWLTAYPTVAKLLRRRESVLNNIQYRQLVSNRNSCELGFGYYNNGVIRDDIMQWLARG